MRVSRSILAMIAMGSGIAIHQWLLRLTDVHVRFYPHLADPVLSRLPTLDIDVAGEIGLAAFLLVYGWHHFRRQPERTPLLLVAIGMLFAGRGLFLWLMPIGAPPGAPADALQVYPYSNHSYFPSGHVGFISLCAWLCRDRHWRQFFLTIALVFGVGTMLAKAHYTADLLGALLLSHAVATVVLHLFGRTEAMSTTRQVSDAGQTRQGVASVSGLVPGGLFEGAEPRASSSSETPPRR